MKTDIKTVEEYIGQLPAERKDKVKKLRKVVTENLPEGFREEISYGMIGYVVPHDTYPAGYHSSPDKPLPFMNIASQKNHIALYHMGVYAEKEILEWFFKEYAETTGKKPDMGKSCIRFKENDDIPYELIGELSEKMTVRDWIALYEKNLKR